MSSLQTRLRLAIGASVLLAVSLSLLLAGYLVRRSLEHTAFNGLRRQVTLLAHEDLHPPPGAVGSFLATQDERLSVLPRKEARLLLPDAPSGRVTVDGRKYLYAARPSGADVLVLLRTAASVEAETRPFWIAFLAAAALGLVLVIALTALLARGIALPVLRVTRASTRLAAGEAPQPLPLHGSRELRTLATAFNEMASQLVRARAAERSFLLSVSHELKTPLTAIRGYAEALDEGVLSADRAVRVIRTEAGRLERLVTDLINLARLNRDRFDIRLERVDLAELARETAARHAARARELGVDLRVETKVLPAPALADRDRLLQAASNLVENALRCTPPHGSVRLAAAAGRLAVADTGPGIAPRELPHAFERFFLHRLYNGKRPGGTGVGLSIVRDLARAMAGDVHVETSARGTTFVIQLPTPEDEPRRAAALHAFTQV